MTLQEEMFALVSAWKSSGLTKKTFLADKPIGLPKFNYWSARHGQHMASDALASVSETGHFRELIIDDRTEDKIFDKGTEAFQCCFCKISGLKGQSFRALNFSAM